MKRDQPTPILDYGSATNQPRARVWTLRCAIVVPTLTEITFLALSNRVERGSELINWLVVALGLALGGALIAVSRLRARVWVPMLFLYIPIQVLWLVLFMAYFPLRSGDSF